MYEFIGWVRIQAPDRETAVRRLTSYLAGVAEVEKVQSEISHRIEQEEDRAATRGRNRFPDDGPANR